MTAEETKAEEATEEAAAEETKAEEAAAEETKAEEAAAEETKADESEAGKTEETRTEEKEPEDTKADEEISAEYPCLASLKEDTILYTDEYCRELKETLAADAVIVAVKAEENSVEIRYAEMAEDITICQAYVKPGDLILFSAEETTQWQFADHPVSGEFGGFKLEAVKFADKEDEKQTDEPEAEKEAAKPQEDKPTEQKEDFGKDSSSIAESNLIPSVSLSYSLDNGYEYVTAKVAGASPSGAVKFVWKYYDNNGYGPYDYTTSYSATPENYIRLSIGTYAKYRFYCVVKVNGAQVESPYLTIVPGTVTCYPANQDAVIGTKYYFSAYYNGFDGVQSLKYQWQYSTNGGKSWINATYTGYNTDQMAVTANAKTIRYLYRCAIIADGVMVPSQNSVYMVAAVATSNVKSAKRGQKVTFDVNCENATGTIRYQWQLSADNGKTWRNSVTTKKNVIVVNESVPKRLYRCVVTDNNGEHISNTLSITGLLTAYIPTTVVAANMGSTARIYAYSAFAGGSVTYLWQYSADKGKTWKSATTYTGYQTNILRVKVTADNLPYLYRCIVQSAGKKDISASASIYSAKATPKVIDAKVGKTVTFTATACHGTGTLKYQWEVSTNQGTTWRACTFTGNKTNKLSVKISATNMQYYYRCKVTDKTGTVISNLVRLKGPMQAKLSLSKTGVEIGTTVQLIANAQNTSGTITYTWQYSKDNGTTWEKANLQGAKPSVVLKESMLTYLYRCIVKDQKASITTNSVRLIDFTLSAPKPVYRALLIGERDFNPYCARNGGDVVHMASMLNGVYGPGGTKYQVTTKYDLGYYGVRDAIKETFADTKDTDVSIFMIATHGAVTDYYGQILEGESAGALATMDWSIYFSELADWLNTYVKGKVIVIIESCGSGSAIYKEGVSENRALANAADEMFVQQAISAFEQADHSITVETTEMIENRDGTMVANTGELRTNKFYVLAASRHGEYSYGETETGSSTTQSQSGNVFINGLVKGVGSKSSSPADKSPKNKVLTLEELYSYCVTYARNWSQQYSASSWDEGVDPDEAQHTQRYPKNSKYSIFMFK